MSEEEKEVLKFFENKEYSFTCEVPKKELYEALGIEETDFETEVIRIRTLIDLIYNQQKEIENLKSFICKIRNELKGNIITFDGKDYAPAKNLTKQEVYESYVKLITLLKSNYVFKENEDFIKELLEE